MVVHFHRADDQVLGAIGRFLSWPLGVLWGFEEASGRLKPLVAWHRGQRVSLVAQSLKAKGPISLQRVYRALDDLP